MVFVESSHLLVAEVFFPDELPIADAGVFEVGREARLAHERQKGAFLLPTPRLHFGDGGLLVLATAGQLAPAEQDLGNILDIDILI